MTTLYRSPTVIIDAHEWHVIVKQKDGRIFKRFYFRPLTLRRVPWQPISSWVGPKPKGLGMRLSRFNIHVEMALDSDKLRRAAVARLPKIPTGAMLRNSTEMARCYGGDSAREVTI